jgi:phosphate/sulfate permease
MGMTLQALNAISALAVSWSSTKIPKYSTLIELKQYKELDNLFFRTTKQAGFVEAVLMIMFFCIILLIRYYHIVFFDKVYLGDRFLDYIPLILMIIPMYLQQYINAWAIYLRCHKQEPYLWLSVISGIYMLLGTMLIGKFWGVVGISGNYCIEQIIGMVFAYYIFVIKRREWHGAE